MAEPTARVAFDANVLFYAHDTRDAEKRRRCAAILRAAMAGEGPFLTLQALGEFAHAVVRKGVLTRPEAARAARDWALVLGARGANEAAFDLALQWWAEERFAHWDALILATSLRAGATAFVSEDLADGMVVAGVEVVSPFAPDALERIAAHGLSVVEASGEGES